ncbi:IclR family transcriptional regulator C-terminal domain-containing protein [Mycetocola sp.]|uniref:IclR family transcriptional regulator n=1 Tax=Mycetocola sp. TaxID=1871042 RepID=UPI0026163C60|nr:IclR family transcriptional regulator C-terminal domain-containing protein [Mycetocola sp.]
MTGERDGTLLGSVQRAIAVTDVVADARRPLPVKAIARACGLTLGTTYNIVRTLVHEGVLAHEPDGLVLGHRFPSLRPEETDGVFLARARATLRGVSKELGVTACLSRFIDGEIHVLDVVDAPHSPRVDVWVGPQDSAHASALGKRILSDLEAGDRLDYLSRHPLRKLTQNTISDRRTLLQHLDAYRCASIDVEEYAVGVRCLAVPVRAPGVIGSLAVGAPADSAPVDVAHVVKRMRSAASRLSLSRGVDGLA